MSWENIVKKPFIYGDDKLPNEEMKAFLEEVSRVLSKHRRSDDAELIDLIDRLEDFLQLGGPSGANLNLKDRMKRIQGK
tara:strand:- start:63 stop:299 length:237 start_codon:yes stop_codon:yes gene_type:complete